MKEELFVPQNPSQLTEVAVGYRIAAPMAETKASLDELAIFIDGQHRLQRDLVTRVEAREKLTGREKQLAKGDVNTNFVNTLDDKLTRRLYFYKRIHNWHGDRSLEHSGHYQALAEAAGSANTLKDSYAWYVLRDVRHDVLENVQQVIQQKGDSLRGSDVVDAIVVATSNNAATVKNEELRFYINELVWFGVKETMKQLQR